MTLKIYNTLWYAKSQSCDTVAKRYVVECTIV